MARTHSSGIVEPPIGPSVGHGYKQTCSIKRLPFKLDHCDPNGKQDREHDHPNCAPPQPCGHTKREAPKKKRSLRDSQLDILWSCPMARRQSRLASRNGAASESNNSPRIGELYHNLGDTILELLRLVLDSYIFSALLMLDRSKSPIENSTDSPSTTKASMQARKGRNAWLIAHSCDQECVPAGKRWHHEAWLAAKRNCESAFRNCWRFLAFFSAIYS
jgi:hypothetical protein